MKKRNIFEPLVGVKAKNTHVGSLKHSKNERWLFGVLSADDDAPTVEDEKSPRRYYFLYVVTVLVFAVLLGRAFQLQIVEGGRRLKLAQENRFREQVIRAPRGILYDRNGIPLVKNIPNYEVTAIPSDLPKEPKERNDVYDTLAKTISMPTEEIKTKAESKGFSSIQPILISKSVTEETALVFESRKNELPGFYVAINPIREYLDNGLLSHVFGYVGRISEAELKKNKKEYILTDFIGKSGIEKSFEAVLRGKAGRERIEVDSTGKVIRTYGQESPILGENLELTIDFELQKKLAENLGKQMEKAKVGKGSAVAVNPQNGEILALVNLPSYDNNLFAKGISEKDYTSLLNNKNTPLLNRVFAGEYPSGSIIKPYIAIAGLEEGNITEKTTVNSTGGIKIGTWEFPDFRSGGYGIVNVTKAIAQSVNTYFYAVGGGYKDIKGLGPDLMKKYLEMFGLGQKVSLDVEGQSLGQIPTPEWKEEVKNEPWYLGDTYHMAIGQGDVLVTPIQMVNAVSVIANGGTMYKLHLVKAKRTSDGKKREEIKPEVVKSGIASAKSIDIVRRGMKQGTIDGGSRLLGSLPGGAAGKTGTAQFGPNNAQSHAWFEGFAPYDNPQIAIVVLVEGGGYGEAAAVPVVNDTLRWYFSRKK